MNKCKRCEHCKGEFVLNRPHQRFCSSKCRMTQWEEENPRITKHELEVLKSLATNPTV